MGLIKQGAHDCGPCLFKSRFNLINSGNVLEKSLNLLAGEKCHVKNEAYIRYTDSFGRR